MKKGLRELEQTLQNTRRSSDGSLNLVGGRKSDPESFLEGGFRGQRLKLTIPAGKDRDKHWDQNGWLGLCRAGTIFGYDQ